MKPERIPHRFLALFPTFVPKPTGPQGNHEG